MNNEKTLVFSNGLIWFGAGVSIDLISDGKNACVIRNEHPLMAKITGTACMLTALLTAFIVANQDQIFEAAIDFVCGIGLCGEKANKRMSDKDGNAIYQNFLIDTVFNLNGNALENGAKYELC
ncbi:MAG: hydroxyethylthiazole kinase [Eubacteriaceae bacterium]|jgi:hydroxyethylthiazole kinase|nr:hydroxyethylthiazole kinase [Eubacteriaceae bacterium]MDK2905882.1 hydroxyethylthiazole kinase [Eubacteriaceae bacterium]MDK2937096.1 hydroxyethylthiazole kinase [Eubacteriaceae bacterium]MDK2962276.1 hydroxyethylthiazole kinase [Eubacteriaceae bacterium]MDN5308084.1 hydroxyethylthiazole kinase [Eubacteriaceae bacterium]